MSPTSTPLHACGVDDDTGFSNPVPGVGHFSRALPGHFSEAAKARSATELDFPLTAASAIEQRFLEVIEMLAQSAKADA
jgi:hypothetical protein